MAWYGTIHDLIFLDALATVLTFIVCCCFLLCLHVKLFVHCTEIIPWTDTVRFKILWWSCMTLACSVATVASYLVKRQCTHQMKYYEGEGESRRESGRGLGLDVKYEIFPREGKQTSIKNIKNAPPWDKTFKYTIISDTD